MMPTDSDRHTTTPTIPQASRKERRHGAHMPTPLQSSRSRGTVALLAVSQHPPGRRKRRIPGRTAQTDLPASRGCQGTAVHETTLQADLSSPRRKRRVSQGMTTAACPARTRRTTASCSSVSATRTTSPTPAAAAAAAALFLCLFLHGPQPVGAQLNLTLGIFVPQTGFRRVGPEAMAAINWTVDRINQQFGGQFQLRFVIKDTQCDKDLGLTEFVNTVCENKESDQPVNVVIGPTCDDVCVTVGGLGGNKNVPIISNGCGSHLLADRVHYPTFLRTMGAYTDALDLLMDMFRHFKWTRLSVVHGTGISWLDATDEIASILMHSGFETRLLSIRHHETAKEDLKKESKLVRVFLLCMYSDEVVYFMDLAEELGLRNGMYAFVVVDFANLAKVHDKWSYLPVLDGLLDVTFDVIPNSAIFKEFKDHVFSTVDMAPNSTCPSDYELVIHSSLLSDAVTLYAAVVNDTINDHCDPTGGRCFVEHMRGVSVGGVTGLVDIDSTGHRRPRFMMHNIQAGCYVPIATLDEQKKLTILNNPVVWPGGSRAVPANNPECGWQGELCIHDNTTTMIIIAGAIGGLALLLCVFTFAAYKYSKWRESMRKMLGTDWKIDFQDLKRPRNLTGLSHSSSMFIRSSSQLGSALSVESGTSARSAMRANEGLYFYKGEIVAVKFVTKNYGLGVPETPKLCKELNQILRLENRNINPFVGACTEKDHLCIVNAYAGKGSLFDVLHKSDLTFDCRFVASFSTDVSKGLAYIHSSEVAYHGRLKSRNVFVDNMFTAKIGDFHMETFREGEVIDENNECYSTRNLWSAIEVVTGDIYVQEKTLDARARTLLWQHADMWSFGVIMHEIVNREKPYPSLFDTDPIKAEKMLSDRVRPDEGHLERLMTEIRTRKTNITSEDQFTMKVLDLIANCWQTFADMRVNSTEAAKRLKEYAKSHKLLSSNMYENLMHMMTKNEDDLNRQVQMRTELLENERNKTQNLLLQMLPAVVAKQLVQGKTPEAECYECVTIFFSDVVGFTQLCATVQPLEVMDIMNHLYLCFDRVIESYDVYKVETIGDAYMVASGLPERNDQHAEAIADMAMDLLSRMDSFEIPHKPNYHLNVRVGLHSGPVVAGVVGSKMPRYCVFGDTVNTASRMESHGKALLIHVSQPTKELLQRQGNYHLVQRMDGLVVKGKGEMATFWLTGKDGFPHQFLPPEPADNGTQGS